MTVDRGEGWRDRAVDRSLRRARDRAVTRSERFIAAATDILLESGDLGFTVQDLLERSGLSLRSFYQHFAGKDELVLAVLEEAIDGFVAGLRASLEDEADPLNKLRVYVTGFYEAGRSGNRRASAALSRYLLTLTSSQPSELARVLRPQLALLAEIIDQGVEAGVVRKDIPPSVLTILVSQTLMSAVETRILGAELGNPVGADDLWAYCLAAVTGSPASPEWGGDPAPLGPAARPRTTSARR